VVADLDKILKIFPICLRKLLKKNHRPAKLSYSFSSKWRKNSARLKHFPPLNPKVLLCLWFELCTTVLLRRVAARSNHGPDDGRQGAQIPGHWTTMKAPNNPNIRTWGRQTCFLPRAPSILVTPLSIRRLVPSRNSSTHFHVAKLRCRQTAH